VEKYFAKFCCSAAWNSDMAVTDAENDIAAQLWRRNALAV